MSKLAFFVTTLIAAVPAAFLAFLSVTAFLFHSGELSSSPVLMVVTGLTLLLSVAVAALPAAVLLRKDGQVLKGDKRAAPEVADESEEDEASGDEAFAEDDENPDDFEDGTRRK